MDKLISVIVPVYNREAYIAECLQSVQAQSWKNFEILVIDDGSTDASLQICCSIAEQDPRIRILQGEHKGVSQARNLGLEAARGEYILFVDSDDIIHSRLMEALATGMEREHAAIGGTMGVQLTQQHWESNKNKMLQSSKEPETTLHSNEDTVHKLLTEVMPLSVLGGVMIRRDWVGQTRFRTDLTIGEDFYFVYENLIKGASAVFLKQRWYLNRIHDTNTSWDYSYTGFMTRLRRRELVWQSEEQLGREKHASGQKAEVFAIYRKCVSKAGIFSADGKKMRKTLRSYRKIIAPVLRGKTKLMFYFFVYLPFLAALFPKSK